MSEFDCTKCGACCVAEHATDFVPLTALDRKRLPTKYKKKVVDNDIDTTAPYRLPNKQVGEFVGCTALKGKVGRDARCDVYSQRPDHCRYAITKGDEACLAARKRLGVYDEFAIQGEGDAA